MRNNILIIALILTLLCVFLALQSGKKFTKSQDALIVERNLRFDAERNLSRANLKIKLLDSEVRKFKSEIETKQSLLSKEKGTSLALRSQLDKVLEINAQLEKELKNFVSAESGNVPIPEM